MKKFIVLVTALISMTLCQLNVQSKNALLIANASYKNFGSLATPVNEAKDLKKALESIGFNVTLVQNCSKEEMMTALGTFEKTLKAKGGTGFFHYGGHAVQVNGKNYLIPSDADIPDEQRV